jgi:hypothetical protein
LLAIKEFTNIITASAHQMNAPSASATPISGLVSETPKQAPSSFRLSPPPLKQNRLPRHLAIPIEGAEGAVRENSSSLISIMHGHELTTPRNFSFPTNVLPPVAASCLAENPEDSMEQQRVDNNSMADEIAEFEVAMFSCISRGHNRDRPADQRAASASAAQFAVESRAATSSRPFFPSNDEFSMSPLDRQRFALLPKINLFQEKY